MNSRERWVQRTRLSTMSAMRPLLMSVCALLAAAAPAHAVLIGSAEQTPSAARLQPADTTAQEVFGAVVLTAERTIEINQPLLSGWGMIDPCGKVAVRRWHCSVIYSYASYSFTDTVTYKVSPALIRKRRNNHWVGPWKIERPLRWAVTGIVSGPISSE